MTRTCNELGVCQSRGCDGCHYPFYPGGQPVWPWGNWTERAAAGAEVDGQPPKLRARGAAAHDSARKSHNRIRAAIEMVEGGRSKVVENIERQRTRPL